MCPQIIPPRTLLFHSPSGGRGDSWASPLNQINTMSRKTKKNFRFHKETNQICKKCGNKLIITTRGNKFWVQCVERAHYCKLTTQYKKKKKGKTTAPSRYRDYIKSKEWEQRKNKYYQGHKRQCDRCGSLKHIHLHHAVYAPAEYGREKDKFLFPLCRVCHMLFHSKNKTKNNMTKETLSFIAELK